MKYERIIFLKRNDELVGIGIQKDGIKKLLTLNEAVKEASILKKANKENAIEFLNSKRKVEDAKAVIYNEKPRKRKLGGAKVASIALAIALVGAGGAYALDKSLEGDANLTAASQEGAIVLDETTYNEAMNNKVEKANEETDKVVSEAQAKFNELLNASESQTQIEYVTMMSDYIRYFNIDFANTYKQVIDGEEVKPALSWNYEIPALTIAYNDLSKKEILQVFNGIELNANTLDANYKNATLQLFGAYVISDSSKPVQLYNLIESEEGKEFVKKYENMFYAIKDAKTEDQKISLINDFYGEIYKDFPIGTEIREEGISHLDARALMDNASYKLAVTPMVTALETMYQNLEYDKTLSSKAIDYFNDLGMCNIAYEKFQKAEFVLEDSKVNEKYADFGQLSKIIISELKERGAYVIDDAHRDLSQLDSFQKIVNGHFDGSFDLPIGDSKTTTTHKRIKIAEWTETKVTHKYETKKTRTSDRDVAVDKAGEKKVKEAEDKVRDEINKENQANKEKAEKEAAQKQKEEQAKEDEKAKEKQKEADKANEQVQKDIDDMNDKINHNQPVNDKDYDNVTIDNSHKDDNGNLNDSVKEITTDSSGANKPLPNPKDTGKDFDSKAKSAPAQSSAPKAETSAPKTESTPSLPDPKETGKEFDEQANEIVSNEQLVEMYIDRIMNLKANTVAHAKVLRK